MRWQIAAVFWLVLCGAIASHAGGPAFVAGAGYNSGIEGQALIWAGGEVQYFTDQGNLSSILTGAQADALVATAFSTWISIAGVALTASQGGHLAEDVNGSNIVVAANGTITSPADISPSAVGTPLGIVYDYDGTVTDALLGTGAGDITNCFANAVYGEPDNFSASGNIIHALMVINGICASTSAQLPDVQYRMVRVLGRILGLGWSQANVNVLTREPVPTSADFAGFPLMHYTDPISCVPITACFTNPGVPAMDDIDALTRLYPGNANPQSGRVYGSVYFTDASGSALQPMQGVNVVARLMASGQPSRQYVVTSVSGFSFCGNAGNIIDGYVDANGLPYDRWGSGDPSLEGFFDLGQLTIAVGQTTAEYQLSVEALDPNWSLGVIPYAPTQVTPSGSFAPIVVTVSIGSNTEQDILMLQDEIVQTHPGSGSTYASPAALPQGGSWGSWISGYGNTNFFQFTAQANRTASVAVIALDEEGQPTETKLLPVIGIWELSDQSGDLAPASTPSAFNSTTFAMTRLDAQFGTTEAFRVGVADFRGDGRPDYFYQANLLYSDTVTPARLSVAGGVTALNGIGFSPGLQVTVGSSSGTTLAASASQMEVALPPASQDGTATIQVTDPETGSSSQMIGALTYGALSTDLLLLLQGAEPSAKVGAPAANPIRVRAVTASGVTPVNGATIAWSAANGLQLSVCNGASSCSVLSDEAGESSSWVTPTATGQSAVTIALAPASYSPPQTQLDTVVATSTSLDLVALTPTQWVAQGATLAIPLTVEALKLGTPTTDVPVNFAVTNGTASLSAVSTTTGTSGLATVTVGLANLSATVQVVACIAADDAPCQTFTLFSAPPSLWALETVEGSLQIVTSGQSFQPLTVRVTDGSAAANPVMGVDVLFETTLAIDTSRQGGQGGNPNVGSGGVPVILGSSQAQVVTTQTGLASIVPSAGSVGPCDVFIAVGAGQQSANFDMQSVAATVPLQPANSQAKTTGSPGDLQLVASFGGRSGAQIPTSQAVPESLYTVPPDVSSQDTPNNDSTVDSPAGDSVESSDAAAFGDRGVPPSNPAASENRDFPTSAKPAPEEAKAVLQTKKILPGTTAPTPENPTPPESPAAPKPWPQEDKRSCHSLAADGPFF